ncbi:MAG: molybdate ABC transporter substrate-binding protein [Oscillospiraceae bacterium]|nr:molybdate ABC transporter substrate-binding protein [Oscillospiraceae bacterium]
MKKITAGMMTLMFTIAMCSCAAPADNADTAGSTVQPAESTAKEEITILAAASLTDVCGELESMYNSTHPDVSLVFSFGSSGALQTQIEEGAPADIFFSASTKQMDALDEKGLMDKDSINMLLENKIVLVVPADSDKGITSFDDVVTDKVKMIGLGEPESVPAGQYAEQVFITLGTLEDVKAKANYGTDVRTVLSWVETGDVDCGVVYATDAYSTDKVKIAAEAPDGSCKKVIYPVGIVGSSAHVDAAKKFEDFLTSQEAMEVFEKFGFTKAVNN